MTDLAKVERNRQVEQQRLDRLKELRERNGVGQFATSPALALEIARYVAQLWDGRPGPIRFLEPALGTGAFYSAFLRAFPPDRWDQSLGVEVDPAFVRAATRLWQGTGINIVGADFTRLEPPGADDRYNLIVTNPPYVRHHHLGREDKERLKAAVGERLGTEISGLAGLYCHFLLLADEWLSEGGLAVWLIPSEFMEVNYGEVIQRYLTERVKLIRIHRFCPADVQFDDALVTSAVVAFEKARPSAAHRVEMSFGGPLLDPDTSDLVPLSTLRAARKWTAYPAGGRETRKSAAVLGDFFAVKRGIATGSNSFFILERDEALRRGIPERFLRPILPSSRHLREDVIEPDGGGYPRIERPLAVIDCDLPEELVRAQYPKFWAYLEEGKGQGIHEGYLASRRSPWYAQEHREPAPFLCTYMGRRKTSGNPFRFLWNKSAAIAANVYLLLYPVGALKEALRARSGLDPIVFESLRKIDPDQLIGEGRVYGGGLHKLEPKELSNLPAGELARILDESSDRVRQARLPF
jgi:hypothetical protein